ncbi:Apoptosis inhibitor 5 [Fukomys damarensis]|uniref:Apoptosis inhibitor 5 n=1 Tax=Fukomys damarensis TaxID=885580 RepID=A0A091DHR7_FUKDA|nr:Apoptosis inhibitor 5 [Fukomys damarensis]
MPMVGKLYRNYGILADTTDQILLSMKLDLGEDEDVSIQRQAIKELPQSATGENLPGVAEIPTQLLQTDDSAEFNLVNNALVKNLFCS